MDNDVEEVIYEEPPYPDSATLDEQRRAFIIQYLGNPEFDGTAQMKTWVLAEMWLRDGNAPAAPVRKPKLVE